MKTIILMTCLMFGLQAAAERPYWHYALVGTAGLGGAALSSAAAYFAHSAWEEKNKDSKTLHASWITSIIAASSLGLGSLLAWGKQPGAGLGFAIAGSIATGVVLGTTASAFAHSECPATPTQDPQGEQTYRTTSTPAPSSHGHCRSKHLSTAFGLGIGAFVATLPILGGLACLLTNMVETASEPVGQAPTVVQG